MHSPQKSPQLTRHEARDCVHLWFRDHAKELAQWTAGVRRELRAADAAGDRARVSSAVGKFAEKLFFETQLDLARTKTLTNEVYEEALNVLTAVIRIRVWRLVKKTLGTLPGANWTTLFTERMSQLVAGCREQHVELFRSDIGLVIEPRHQLEINFGGSDEGIRILPAPADFSKYLRNRIRERGFKSIQEFAKKSLMGRGVIYKLLKGGRVSTETLSGLAVTLDIPFETFVEVVHSHWDAVSNVNKS